MVKIRHVAIQRFRGISSLAWLPSPGLNCLVGPGDSGKSTILDAIELALATRRSPTFTDADFHDLDTTQPIVIDITLGDLVDTMLSIDLYGGAIRGFDPQKGQIADEPSVDLEPVLTVRLTVDHDLEPEWGLYCDRLGADGALASMRFEDRKLIAALRIGSSADSQLTWKQGSVFTRLVAPEISLTSQLAKAARSARSAFGEGTAEDLASQLEVVQETAATLGVDVGKEVQALLDPQSVAFNSGAIALHAENGTPLRMLGLGSMRLLVAGLQRKAAQGSNIVLVDEVEHGLEPHRTIRFLHELGAVETDGPQVFATTHSAVVVCELATSQLHIVRRAAEAHSVQCPPDSMQGTVRRFPDAFLAKRVIVGEGSTEVGFLRGIDAFRASKGSSSLHATGVNLVSGGGISEVYARANVFARLGFVPLVLRDSDEDPVAADEAEFLKLKGTSIACPAGMAIEDEMFMAAPPEQIGALVERAVDLEDEDTIDEHIKSASDGLLSLAAVREAIAKGSVTKQMRTILGKASRSKKRPWFKSIARMAPVVEEIVMPTLGTWSKEYRNKVGAIESWLNNA